MAAMAVSYTAVASLLTASSSLEKLSLPSDCSFRLKRRVLPSLQGQALLTRLGVAPGRCGFAVACLPSTTESEPIDPTKLYISGLSFRTSKDGLIEAFKIYGQLVEVNLVMDRIAKRSRGFAFLRYSNEEESRKAIEGMHGKSKSYSIATGTDQLVRMRTSRDWYEPVGVGTTNWFLLEPITNWCNWYMLSLYHLVQVVSY